MILNSGMSLSFFAVIGTVPVFTPFKFADSGEGFLSLARRGKTK
jgi:hypothetical protein